MTRLPLAGIRVLDFTWVVAGPVATRILADHGAQVVKIERKIPPPLGNRKLGLQCDLHRDKLSAAINMANPRGVDLARKLAAKSDLVIDNFSARVMRGWGMDYDSLQKINPGIICVSMSGLGHTGPRSCYVSYGPTLPALTVQRSVAKPTRKTEVITSPRPLPASTHPLSEMAHRRPARARPRSAHCPRPAKPTPRWATSRTRRP